MEKISKIKKNKGFALMVSIVTTSLLLIISFVVVNVAVRQLILANYSKESQYAFYNADSGIDCAIYWDLKNGQNSAFSISIPGTVTCNNQSISTNSQTVLTNPTQLSRVGGGGPGNPTSIFMLAFTKGCAIVAVTKNVSGATTIDSRGYNTCLSGASRRFERGITVTY